VKIAPKKKCLAQKTLRGLTSPHGAQGKKGGYLPNGREMGIKKCLNLGQTQMEGP